MDRITGRTVNMKNRMKKGSSITRIDHRRFMHFNR